MSNNILIKSGRVIDAASGTDRVADLAIAAGRILAVGKVPVDFKPDHVLDASGCIVTAGLVDLCARLREPGHEHEGLLASELSAAASAGVTSLVCPPDTEPVLDEPGLVGMLKHRSEKLQSTRLLPLGALTRGLAGDVLTEMTELTDVGCVGFSQADESMANTQVLLRALQYASTFSYCVWLRPNEAHLGKGVAASGPLATRMGLSGVSVLAETLAVQTVIELMRSAKARVHLSRLSSAAAVELVRHAKEEGLALTCDVSVHNLHLTDADIGHFDARMRLNPVLRQQSDRAALRQGLADGTIDALVSDHTPVSEDEKTLPFGQAVPGASSVEMLLSCALKWAAEDQVPLARALAAVTTGPANVLASSVGTLASSLGRLTVGGVADVCVFDPSARWVVNAESLQSQSQQSAFAFDIGGFEMHGKARATLVGGQVVFNALH
jgi:dihydroorotase